MSIAPARSSRLQRRTRADTRTPTSCPGCGTESDGVVLLCGPDRFVGGEGTFAAVECPVCGLVSTQPQLRDEDFAAYYPDSYTAYEPPTQVRGGLLAGLGGTLDRVRLEVLLRLGPYRPILSRPPGRLLDVGCGVGDLASTFRRHGWSVSGIDPSESACEHAAARGIEMHRGTLADAPWAPETFDAIVFNHSLEHIPRPAAALERAARLLKPGGVLAVGVPNFESWQRRLFGSRWFQLDLPRHLQHFSTRTLTELVERVGLHVTGTTTLSMRPSLPMSIQYSLAGRAVVTGRAIRWIAWIVWPLLLLADRVLAGDCLHVYAIRDKPSSTNENGRGT